MKENVIVVYCKFQALFYLVDSNRVWHKTGQYTKLVFSKCFRDGFFLPIKITYHVQNAEIWRRNLECADLISAYVVWCHTSRADVKTLAPKRPLLKNVKKKKISLSLVLLNVYQSVVTLRIDHNPTYKY